MTRKNVTLSTVFSLGGDWALASNNNSPGEGDISSSLYNIVFVYTLMVSNNYRLNYLPGHDNKLSQIPRMVSSSASSISRVKTKKRTLLGGGCVEICRNEEISPSPGELLFDASAQSPPSEKTVESVTFFLVTDKWRRFLNCS